MVNAALEKHIIKLSLAGVAAGCIVIIFSVSERKYGLTGFLLGSLLSVSIFFSTAYLYSQLGKETKGTGRGLFSIPLALSFLLMIAVLIWANRFSASLFWCAVAGILIVPLSVILYIIAEAAGISHTGFFV